MDQQNAAVADTKVEVRNMETGLSRSVQTNERGEYRIDFVPPGNYEIEVARAGFRTFKQSGVTLQVGQFARVDVRLQVGDATATVTVEGSAPLVNTTDATVGQTVNKEQITTLPMVNRSVYSLLNLTPGVQNTGNAIALGFPAQRTFINGGADATMGSVNYYLDGGSNVSSLRNTGNTPPNPDAVEEFRVDTNNYSAEYGRFGNGVINVITRSGTNGFHGSLFEFLRNTKLNANTFNALIKPPLHRNQFGGSFGGPIIKNKTFFFGTYSGLRQTTTTFLSSAVVPTAAQRAGDFSAITKPIIDPVSGNPFPNNQIPVNRFDPTAANIMNKYVPLSNFNNNILQAQVPSPYNTDEYLAKVDHQVTDSAAALRQLLHHRGDQFDFARRQHAVVHPGLQLAPAERQPQLHLVDHAQHDQPDLAQLHALLRRTHQHPRALAPRPGLRLHHSRSGRTCPRLRSRATSRSASRSPARSRATTSIAFAT